MKPLKHYWLSTVAIAIGLLIGGYAGASESSQSLDRALYVEAVEAFRANNIHEFDLIRRQISPDYPLQPYLEQMRMSANLINYSIWDIRAFVSAYQDTPIGRNLESDWINLHAEHEDWDDIDPFVEVSDTPPSGCYAIKAALSKGANIKDFSTQLESFWNVPYSQNKACDALFEQWIAAGGLTESLVRSRIIKSMNSENRNLALFLTTYLSNKAEQDTIKQWAELQKNPLRLKNTDLSSAATAFRDAMAVDLYEHLSDHNPLEAKKQFKTIANIDWQKQDTLIKIQQSIALHLALDADEDAEQWIDSLPANAQTQSLQEWRVRQAMKRSDWPGVIRAVEDMKPTLAKTPRWQYWLASAYRHLGAPDKANAIYEKLASLNEYYGYLSAYRVGLPIAVDQMDSEVDPALIIGISALPGVERANELVALNQLLDARKEWYYVIDRLPVNKRLAAARLASRNGWHHFSLYALHHIKDKSDLSLQYPLGHEQIVLEQAGQLAIDPAWVFSITKQESHFKSDAKSSRGAIGLMQILPETAERVALLYDVPYESKWSLVEEEINIQIGTSYLHHLMESFSDHIILATAAYNAGPSKVEEWLPETPVEADLWIETVPFYETRGYLQKVLSNLMIYRSLLGEPSALSETLGPIHAELADDSPESGNRI